MALLALLRLAHDRLLGPDEDTSAEETPILLGTTDLDRPHTRRLEREPRGLALLAGALLALCLAIGLYPDPLLATITDVVRGADVHRGAVEPIIRETKPGREHALRFTFYVLQNTYD